MVMTRQEHADIALAEWQRHRALPAKERVLVVICKMIINNERVRRADPLAVDMLEAEFANYRAQLDAVAEVMRHG